ncbi:hypothetical protein WJX73_006441 [Symbiochloris irregularis]|uniref:ABC transporter domain-containing protein n=1 Tax=Symbiochloris irregularis TaxID=706552 RepID=A0AAW1NT24_9CHLO
MAATASNVCVSLDGQRQVLSNASLSIQKGTLHMLLGPNACGKSTLLRVLGGLLKPDSGTFSVPSSIGYVFQNPDHQVVMPTVAADVAFGLGRQKLPAAEVHRRVLEALRLVGMEDCLERACHTLSGGQKQRVAIAGALVQNPQVLLLDELTTFLEAGDQAAVLTAVRAAVDGPQRVTALWVTHRFEELTRADAASFMDGGRVQMTGTPQNVLRRMHRMKGR